jgi:hypothetical protein
MHSGNKHAWRGRVWVIKPAGEVRSIKLVMTFLAVERGFDYVTISSCPGGKCTEVYKYSDWKRSTCCSWFKALPNANQINTVTYFTNQVDCNEIVVNTNQLEVRFISDGPNPKDTDTKTSKLVYEGFSASYLASAQAVTSESIGCAAANKTLTGLEGSVY